MAKIAEALQAPKTRTAVMTVDKSTGDVLVRISASALEQAEMHPSKSGKTDVIVHGWGKGEGMYLEDGRPVKFQCTLFADRAVEKTVLTVGKKTAKKTK